jgi:hypothetical protein
MKLIISENQYNRFYNILNEQPTGIIKNISSVLAKSNLSKLTISSFQDLIDNQMLTTVIPGGKITKPQQIINNLRSGVLNPVDTAKVLKILFKNETTNKDLLDSIADYIVKNDKNISKYRGKSKKYIQQSLESKYGVEQSKILSDKIYRPNTSLNTIKGLDILGKGFREGYNAPSLLKSVLNWNTFIPEQNAKGWRIFTRWLLTGTTRSISKGFQQVWDTLVKQGIGKDFAKILAIKITSVGAEVFMRWLILNGVIFVFNQIVSYVRENGGDENSKRKNASLVMLAWEDLKNNWGEFGPRWVWPIGTVWGPIVETVDGILRRETPGEIYDKIKSGNLPEQKELEKLNTEVENATLEKPSITDKGELILFKKKVKSKYPNFKYSNNLKIIDGVPYFVYESETYPIYNYNSEYYIKHNEDVIYLDDLTQ